MKVYIKSSTSISPQASLLSPFPWEAVKVYENYLAAIEPEYKSFIPPMKLRRMSRLVRMALSTAKACLEQTKLDNPGAIISASGWGCLTDTYKYLDEISADNQAPPSPATFIQSTHNTPGGQIALHLDCQSYNNVIVNGNTSFEYALMDAIMLVHEGSENVLVGGFDEVTETDYKLKDRAGYWKTDRLISQVLLDDKSPGTMAGEGAAFFLLDHHGEKHENIISDCSILACSPDPVEFGALLKTHLNSLGIPLSEIDLCLLGANGHSDHMAYYNEIKSTVFNQIPGIYYKKLCGEYDTSSSFALWLADQLLNTQNVPENLVGGNKPRALKNILIFNYAGSYKHAITLVSKASI